jgi:hypothetical protein
MKSKQIEQEVIEMHGLNIELMDTLALIGNRFMNYCEKHNIAIEELKSLETLIAKAEKLVNEIGTPYYGNPIQSSDESLHKKKSDEDLTVCARGYCQVDG